MASEGVVCERDGTPTRLACARCGAPICPQCMVGSPVGYNCPPCGGEAAGSPRRLRGPWLVVAGLLVAAVAVAVGLSMLRSEPTTDPDTAVPARVGTDAPPTRQAMIGEEARDGQLAFVVENFSCGAPQSAAAEGGPSAQGKPCLLRLTVRNVSNSPAMFLARFQYLVDSQMKTYGADDALTRARPENANRSLSEVNLNPDIALSVVLVYDVPSSVEPVEARFRGTGRSRFGINVRLQHRP